MYRATSHILNFRSVLYGRPNIEVQTKKISKSAPAQKYGSFIERETCPPPPQLPPTPKDDKLLWGALTGLVLTGGFVYYAKNNPEVRDWLTIYAPWFDDFIAVAYQENMTYKEYAEKRLKDARTYIQGYYGDDVKPKQCSGAGVVIDGPVDKTSCEKVASKCDEKVEPEKCDPSPPVITKTICEVDACLREIGDDIVNNYFTAKEACLYYNKLVEERMVDFRMASFKDLHEAMAERRDVVQTSTCNILEASQHFENLARYLECGVQGPKEVIDATEGLLADYYTLISAKRMLFQWENDKSVELDKQVVKVEELMNKYTEENKILFTGLQYDDKKLELQGDPDILLYQTQRYAAQLQAELREASDVMTERVNRAIKTLPHDENARKARCSLLQAAVKKRRAALDQEYRQRYDDQRAANDKTLREALRNQQKIHEANLQANLDQKEKELLKKLDIMVAEAVAAEKREFARLLDEMAAQLKIVEDKLNARLKAERETRRSQVLWSAGEALLAATKRGDPVVCINKELAAIEKASDDDDKLVQVVLKSIPDSVLTQGLVPESVLRERYHKMEKTAMAVALVEAEGGPLPMYILSWIQSQLLFMKLSCLPQSEIDKPPDKPTEDMDTFDLLRRARYYMQHGDVSRALRYVSALEGASAIAAVTWRDAARAHVAARQAADAVRAHAAALGVRHL